MEYLLIHFPVAEIETFVFISPVVAFFISFFSSMAGISGAFLLLPIQVSLLGFTSLAFSSTNLLYNVVGTPGFVLGYARGKRRVWPLAATIIIGTVPGVLAGYFLRVKCKRSQGCKVRCASNHLIVSVYRVPQMQGVGCADVLLYFKRPTTKQMRCPVNAYGQIVAGSAHI